ncbi:MAG TPA: DUF3150 domain-containing protein [Terriglobia bacterium]|nr:DUF3150 domain-containing protein [Terriglobia bacterium]
MATAPLIFDLQTPGDDLARKTVFVKLRLGLLGNSRKVSPAQVEVDADKASIHVSKSLLNSCELEAIRRLDGEMRRYLYGVCLPFEPGIHLLPIPLIETVDSRLREFQGKRQELVEVFLAAYPRLCEEAASRLRTLYNPLDYAAVEEVRSAFSCSWQYVSYGVPDQLRAVSERMFQEERDKAADRMAEAYTEVRQVLREAMAELVAHLRDRLADQPDGTPQRVRESTVQKLREFLDTFDFRNVTNDQELKDQVERARGLLAGTTTDAIRNTAELRVRVRDGMANIAGRLETMVSDRVGRKFRLDEA